MISWYMSSSCIVPSVTRSGYPVFRRLCPEELLGVADAVGQGVDLGVRVVEVEARPVGCLAAEGAVQRPRAVVTRPDRNAELVEYLADVVRVHALDLERDGSAAVLRGQRPEDADALDLAERLKRVRGQCLLVRGDVVHAERGQVVHRRAEARGQRHRGDAGLELGR